MTNKKKARLTLGKEGIHNTDDNNMELTRLDSKDKISHAM